ncbi:general transcription factor 3C polypeptide 6 [Nilaparvata lugens]|uniref:general transcription factor 3C polypeptide 6 n=1 Tax=Nilaparvata lugens TaxID=108931 RepID=UPI00193D466D|nr:general transcription factor 3C polypeptide 6 [Nilaparvata lugens]XP_022189145.2 general transcription factor 3C polypeptide 6 [Nilaparvata lugens]
MEGRSMKCEYDNFESALGNPTADEDDDEYDEEEVLVHVQFDCDVDTKLFNSEEPKIIGLDTENPIMQMGPQFYRGKWQDIVGTSVFFAPGSDPPAIDPLFSRVKTPLMKLTHHTRKSLLMSRVFVKPITGQNPDQVTPECGTDRTNECETDRTIINCAKTGTEDTSEMEIETSAVTSDQAHIETTKT